MNTQISEPYIDRGDRIVVTEGAAEEAHARTPRPELIGKHGIVLENDGWGLCRVQLDDGSIATFWNSKDLKRE